MGSDGREMKRVKENTNGWSIDFEVKYDKACKGSGFGSS